MNFKKESQLLRLKVILPLRQRMQLRRKSLGGESQVSLYIQENNSKLLKTMRTLCQSLGEIIQINDMGTQWKIMEII